MMKQMFASNSNEDKATTPTPTIEQVKQEQKQKQVDFETMTSHINENISNDDYQAAAKQAQIEAQGLTENFDHVDSD